VDWVAGILWIGWQASRGLSGNLPMDWVADIRGICKGAPAPDKMTGLHGITSHELLLQAKVKKVLQRIEPAVDGCPRTAMLMLVLHKVIHLTKGDLGQGHSDLGKTDF
jgi:hypothetical protein